MQKKRVYQMLGAGIVCMAIAGTAVYAGNLPLKVNVQEVRTGSITQTIEADGHIESEEEQTYYARVTAPVALFDARAGDLVHKGKFLSPMIRRTLTGMWSRQSYRQVHWHQAIGGVQRRRRKCRELTVTRRHRMRCIRKRTRRYSPMPMT